MLDPARDHPFEQQSRDSGSAMIRSISSHLYAKAGYETGTVKDLMAHTDPDMTRHYQKGHERKVVRVEMALPLSLFEGPKDGPHG